MKKAIVIGCQVNGLGVIRSLGLKGFQIIAMSYDGTDFGHASKYVYEKLKIPHPRIEEKEFVDFLIQNSHKWKDVLTQKMSNLNIGAITVTHWIQLLFHRWYKFFTFTL